MSIEPSVPEHIAIILDGNGRWAKQRNQPRFMGHRAGVKAVENIVNHCTEIGVSVLSLFVFSSENWQRPDKEVGLLMELFALSLKQQVKRLYEHNIQLQIIGDLARFSTSLQKQIDQAQQLTAANTGLTLNIAANYGGRWDITQAMKRVTEKTISGELATADITEDRLAMELTTASLPEPDLFIRTSGEQRISNFLLWQMAYTELYFTDILWPDFTPEKLDQAIAWFNQRERRFGKTSKQVRQNVNN